MTKITVLDKLIRQKLKEPSKNMKQNVKWTIVKETSFYYFKWVL